LTKRKGHKKGMAEHIAAFKKTKKHGGKKGGHKRHRK
jgi:hypothetical protein